MVVSFLSSVPSNRNINSPSGYESENQSLLNRSESPHRAGTPSRIVHAIICEKCQKREEEKECDNCKGQRIMKNIPSHWNSDFPGAPRFLEPILKGVFTVLVMISFGHTSLDHKWKMTQWGEEKFAEDKDRIASRISTITVVVSGIPFATRREY